MLMRPVLMLLWLLSAGAQAADYPRVVTDLAGRSVTLAHAPQRIVLQDSNDVLALALLGVWGAMEPKTNVSSESHRKGAFRSPAHPPGITL